jgi:hypothetical protein
MAYKVVNKITKQGTSPWPWITMDQPWMNDLAEILLVGLPKSMQIAGSSPQERFDWYASQSTGNTLTIEHVFETQSEANAYVLAVYEMVMDRQQDLERYAVECGAGPIEHTFDIQEV